MRYIMLLLLLASPVFAEPDDDFEEQLQSMDYRLQNVEKDVSALKKAQQAPVRQQVVTKTQQSYPTTQVDPKAPRAWAPGQPIPENWNPVRRDDGSYILVYENEKHGSH